MDVAELVDVAPVEVNQSARGRSDRGEGFVDAGRELVCRAEPAPA